MLRNWKKLCRKPRKTENGGCWTSSGCPFSTDRNGVEKEYMTLLMRDQENVEKGREYGEELMLALMQKLVADKRFGEIERIKDDKDYRLILYREYHII